MLTCTSAGGGAAGPPCDCCKRSQPLRRAAPSRTPSADAVFKESAFTMDLRLWLAVWRCGRFGGRETASETLRAQRPGGTARPFFLTQNAVEHDVDNFPRLRFGRFLLAGEV